MRQNLEKNIEKVVAVTLSLGMVALNTCSNSSYSNKTVFSSNFKNEKTVYATELSESDKIVPEKTVETFVDFKVSNNKPGEKASAKKNISRPSSASVKIVKKPAAVDQEPELEEVSNTIDEETQWDRLIENYEKYEILELDPTEPQEDNFDSELLEPVCEVPELDIETEVPVEEVEVMVESTTESEENKSDISENPDENLISSVEKTIDTQDLLTSTPEDEKTELQEDVQELVETLVPTIVHTPFGSHLEFVGKQPAEQPIAEPVAQTTDDSTSVQDATNSAPEITSDLSVTVYDEKQAFLDSIPEEGINGYSKVAITTLITLGIPLITVVAIVGAPWVIQKFTN